MNTRDLTTPFKTDRFLGELIGQALLDVTCPRFMYLVL